MDLRHLTDEAILSETKRWVGVETEAITAVLHHLKENDRRKLFSTLKCKSLYAYAEEHLGYSNDQAYRRIAAMRLLRDMPEIEEKINSGSLNLTHMGMAQCLFRKENYSKTQKLEILEKIETKSTREAERVLLEISPRALPAEKIKPLTPERTEYRFSAGPEFAEKVEKLKGYFAHTHPHMSLEELFEKVCDMGLEKISAAPRKPKTESRFASTYAAHAPTSTSTSAPVNTNSNFNLNVEILNPISKPISKRALYREVKSRGSCENCGSYYALESDHIMPAAMGGETTRENLRLLCRSCNQRAAVEKFGVDKMARYLT